MTTTTIQSLDTLAHLLFQHGPRSGGSSRANAPLLRGRSEAPLGYVDGGAMTRGSLSVS
jgi:hypothetical protein